MLRRILAVPLVGKLIGANALLVVAAAALVLRVGTLEDVTIVVAALLASFAVNVALVRIALRPLTGLEVTAARLEAGDLAARVPPSRVADRDLARIGRTLNHLVDRLTGDRARMQELASQVIHAQDAERSRIARELHDSIAQTLAAVLLQVRAVALSVDDAAIRRRLEPVRATVADALEEVRTMSHVMYPRVLDDLGLGSALRWLATRAEESSGILVRLEESMGGVVLRHDAASVLYRVAQEALQNAVAHAGATRVILRLELLGDTVRLEVVDDGRGFDPVTATERRRGMGLFAIRERAALVGGRVEIDSAAGRGTTVAATVPISEESVPAA